MAEPEALRELVVEARAKLNLYLRVLGPRADGYHDIDSLVLPLSLADEVTVRLAGPGTRGSLPSVTAVWPTEEVGPRPSPEHDLALRAAVAMAEAHREAPATAVHLVKRIPVAAGLGGGSADAAAVTRGLNELWGRPLDSRRLADVAGGLGSDVPALLAGGPVRVRGRGEMVERIRMAELWWVLLPLGFGVRSADAYRWWDQDGAITGPDPGPALEAAARGDPDALAPALFNDLEAPVTRRHPEVREAADRLREEGALRAMMSGSGPTVAGLVRDADHADLVAARVGESALSVQSLG